jgi:hypothetical protein
VRKTAFERLLDLRRQHRRARRSVDREAALPDRPSLLLARPLLAVRAVARLGVQTAEALEHAHALGVVHRDIKPANLLLDGRGRLWVTDFGLARCQGEAGLTVSADLVGTLRYMSPEQALGRRGLTDHRTDLYSLGVTLYELLTLEPACTGQDRQEVLRQVERAEPRPPRRLNPLVPADLETVVLKALAKHPPDRYATAQELADELGRFLEDRPIRARRPTPRQRAAQWARRHQAVVFAAFAVLAVAVIGLAAVYVRQSTPQQVAENRESLARQYALADHARALGRLERGKLNKARRGELFNNAPIGYVKTPTGGLALDPDDQVRAVVRLIFAKFDELGTAHAVTRYLRQNHIRLGIRPHDGPNRGGLEWRPARVSTVYRILAHPAYAGTYAYGRTPIEPKRRRRNGQPGIRHAPMAEWAVTLHDRLPAYLTWGQYLGNRERLRQNRTTATNGDRPCPHRAGDRDDAG